MDAAADLLVREADTGGVDRDPCAVVIEAAGLPRPRRVLPRA
ncbi:hypothetical protein QFZ67_007444 [Streptomyces sp. V1I1]|nr:hypothetical protein [Streptomyces sp. V1I1]MDQ0945739.1 hypothetical protein [Streptomyces sp. V1I1]